MKNKYLGYKHTNIKKQKKKQTNKEFNQAAKKVGL